MNKRGLDLDDFYEELLKMDWFITGAARHVKTLAAHFKVERMTVTNRLGRLVDKGLVLRLGDGYYCKNRSESRELMTRKFSNQTGSLNGYYPAEWRLPHVDERQPP